MPDVCHICGYTFTQARALQRHLKTVHGIGNDLACVCEICKKFFSRKENLKRHMEFFHLDEPKPAYECHYCGSKFPRRDSLIRHIKTHLERNNFTKRIRSSKYNVKPKPIDENEHYECNDCGRIYNKRKNIVSHVRSSHKGAKNFECEICKRAYSNKHRLQEHIRSVHESKENLSCSRCSRNFVKAESLKQHYERCIQRAKVNSYTASVICVLCGTQFPIKYALTKHYASEHNIEFKYETLKFESREEFEKWKCKLEVSTITQYTSRRVCNTTQHSYRAYECHRSGVYKERTLKDVRLRNLKKQGSKKLQGACPAEIKLKENKSDGLCTITFQSTHVGHEIGNEEELAHINLDKAKRDEIASKIAENIPPTEIIEQEQKSLLDGTCNNRKRSLQRKDLSNIERKHVVSLFPIDKDYDNVNWFVESNRENILYYKEQHKNTAIIDVLKNDPEDCPFFDTDFVLVYLDSTLKQKLKLFAEDGVVCMSSTLDTNPYNFVLITLMVLNLDDEGIPIAYVLSTRNDDVTVSVFLNRIHSVIGNVQIKTFMSNLDQTYYDCWSKIFPVPETWLYCSQEVTKCWKNHLILIENEKTQQNIRNALRNMQRELNEKQFRETLERFLNDQDPELQEFLTYFMANYAGTAERWAYCHRMHAGIDKNHHLESFHDKLKKIKIKSLAEELHHLKKFLAEKLQTSAQHQPDKLQTLKKSHDEALAIKKDVTISVLSEGCWQIECGRQISFIQKVIPRCALLKFKAVGETCSLKCAQCEACLHQYSCSCQDSAIHHNMCKHIHLLVMTLNEESASSGINDGVVMQDYYYVAADGTVINIVEGVVEDDVNFQQEIEDTMSCLKDVLLQRIKTKEEWIDFKKEFLLPIDERLERMEEIVEESVV